MVEAALLLLQVLAVVLAGDEGRIGEALSNAHMTTRTHGFTSHSTGKIVDTVASPSPAVVPRYTATQPDRNKPVAGLPLLEGAEHIVIFNATPGTGTYNHAAQIERRDGVFHVVWNNSP